MFEDTLADVRPQDPASHEEFIRLDDTFRHLQAPMLEVMIRTNLRLLHVWDDRFKSGEGLPYGARELFQETIRIVDQARHELLRPRLVALLEEDALQEANQAEKLLRKLIARAPHMFDFVQAATVDEELMLLINGLARH